MTGIYKLEINGLPYIGSSENVHSRIESHITDLKLGRHCNKSLQNAYNQNPKSLKHEVLHSDINTGQLERHENYYIGIHNSIDGGYNATLARRKSVNVHIDYKDARLITIADLSKEISFPIRSIVDLLNDGFPYVDIGGGKKRYNPQICMQWIYKKRSR